MWNILGDLCVKISYPFKPKSNRHLLAGQYWAIPLSTGKYACGRVIQVSQKYKITPNRSFLAGLMDWVGDEPPKSDDLAGYKTIEQGVVHIKTVQQMAVGGMILGIRPLEIDGIEPYFFRSQIGFQPNHCKLMKGMEELRPIIKEEWEKYTTLGYWGYDFIQKLADKHFGV